MPQIARPRFDTAALRDIAGETVFGRGAAYARQGRVRILSVAPTEVRAEVRGSELYHASLAGDGADISGGCSCPAYESWGFCKHLVAVALAVNEASPDELATADEAEARLRAYLEGQTAQALAERLLILARRDGALWRELDSEAVLAAGDDETILALLYESIEEAIDTDGGIDWRGAGAWAKEVTTVVRRIAGLLAAGRAGVAFAALDHLFDLADDALEEFDDSEREAAAALCEARDLHLAACAKVKPDPVALAAQLFERELTQAFDLWTDARRTYAGPLGKRGRKEYRRLAEAAWRDGGDRYARALVREILDSFAEDDGDVDARIALRAPDANTARDYADLAALCLGAGRREEALAWAEEGVWRLEDRPDRHLTTLTADLMRDAGRRSDAETLLWTAFEREPDERLHRTLKETAADPAGVADRCARAVEARLAAEGASPWSPLPGLLVDILLGEDRADDAWRAARAHRCSEQVVERLARATEGSHPEDAIAAYADLVEANVGRTQNQGYEAACRFLGHLEGLRARQGQSAAHVAHLNSLRTKHKFKRNFIRLLDDRGAWPRF
ncbi:MAG TPA: SWIM zinc finger family protein [Caulobacteraceae bacterium]